MSKEFVVVGDDRVVHAGDSLSAAAIIAGGHPGAAVFERVEISDGKEEMARFDQTMREIQAEADGIRRPAAVQRSLGLFVIEIPNDGTFKPKVPDSTPPSKANGLPVDELCQLAVILNSGEWARYRRVWAAVTGGGGLMLLPCDPKDRPADPRAFPPRTRIMERDEAKTLAVEENTERLAVAYTPRTWTITLRPLTAFVE